MVSDRIKMIDPEGFWAVLSIHLLQHLTMNQDDMGSTDSHVRFTPQNYDSSLYSFKNHLYIKTANSYIPTVIKPAAALSLHPGSG